MNRAALLFDRPDELAATAPPEQRGASRDQVRLLVSTEHRDIHETFPALVKYLTPGDILVVNASATIPASIAAESRLGSILLNLSTAYGAGLWAAEPRWSEARPGPLPLEPGDRLQIGTHRARMVMPYPGIPRLWFVQLEDSQSSDWMQLGKPIRYGYTSTDYGLEMYQNLFSAVPGSAEMPSAARPFTNRIRSTLAEKGIALFPILLHTGVSSLEIEQDRVEHHVLYPEPYEVSGDTAAAVNRAMERGARVVAVGTSVVRALETAWDGSRVRNSHGFTNLYLHPEVGVHVVSGLLTGFHDPVTSHLAMLSSIAGQKVIHRAYRAAVKNSYLWHEFGDSHLILPDRRSAFMGSPPRELDMP